MKTRQKVPDSLTLVMSNNDDGLFTTLRIEGTDDELLFTMNAPGKEIKGKLSEDQILRLQSRLAKYRREIK